MIYLDLMLMRICAYLEVHYEAQTDAKIEVIDDVLECTVVATFPKFASHIQLNLVEGL